MAKKPTEAALLIEYQEAGALCRQLENQTRTTVSVLLAYSTLVLAFKKIEYLYLDVLLSILGVLGSLISAAVIYRLKLYYTAYIKRVRKIERTLGTKLYRSGRKKVPYCFGNKHLMILVCLLIGAFWLIYLIFSVKQLCPRL